MGLLFLVFVLLVTVSVGATFWSTDTQKTDGVIINIAGRQRMLTQQMTWLVLIQAEYSELNILVQNFEQNLSALRDGGLALDAANKEVILPPAPNSALRAQLDEADQTWVSFQALLKSIRSIDPTSPTWTESESALVKDSRIILSQLDEVVIAFEDRAQSKVFRLQIIQTVFFVAALLVFAWGFAFTRRQIISPLATLGKAAQRIGEGNLTEPIPILKNDELGELANTFEGMRYELDRSRNLLEARVLQRTHELRVAFELSQEIVAQLDLDHLLTSVIDHAQNLMKSQAAMLCLLTPDGNDLTLSASSGELSLSIGERQSVERGFVAQVIDDGQTINTEAKYSNCRFFNNHEPGQCAVAPLRVGDQIIGAMCVVRSGNEGENTPIPFDPEEERALTLLANSAAIAINNARLVESERHQTEQAAILSERDRLAAELHDNLAQTLSFLNIKTDHIEELLTSGQNIKAKAELERMRSAIGTAYGQVRTALTDLLVSSPDLGDFAVDISTCVAELSEELGFSVELDLPDPSTLLLPRGTQTQILHIIREALVNVHRHAQVKQAQVRIERSDGWAHFIVEDNGCGFDPAAEIKDNHLGLRIMRTRAERTGGKISIDSSPDKGTKIVASFPLSEPVSSKDPRLIQITSDIS